MMMAITVTKQHQARRYAELYGYGAYGGGLYGGAYGGNPFLPPMLLGGGGGFGRGGGMDARRQMLVDDRFWDEFETGRRGGMHESEARVESFLRLQILQTILRGHVTRGAAYDDDDDEYEYEYVEDDGASDGDDFEQFYEDEHAPRAARTR